MSWAVWARVVPAVALLPIGGLPVRLLLALGAAAFLAARVTAPATLGVGALVGELALGAALGVLASIPVHAATALRGDGPATLGFAGRTWAWAIFFAIGGPALWLGALGATFEALPAAAWPDAADLARAGGALFYAAVVLGLPAWLITVALAPLAGLIDRLGGARHGHLLWQSRGFIALVLLVALLPLLLDILADLWRAGLTS